MQKDYIFKNIHIITISLFMTILGCGENPSNWPNYVTTSLLVPENAEVVKYYTLGGSYQVKYNVKECFPSIQFIDNITRTMISYGWKRLDYDYLNPKAKLNHVSSHWGHYLDKNYDHIYQWTEDFENSKKDIVRYGLMYKTKNNYVDKDNCNLNVVVIYIPKNVR